MNMNMKLSYECKLEKVNCIDSEDGSATTQICYVIWEVCKIPASNKLTAGMPATARYKQEQVSRTAIARLPYDALARQITSAELLLAVDKPAINGVWLHDLPEVTFP